MKTSNKETMEPCKLINAKIQIGFETQMFTLESHKDEDVESDKNKKEVNKKKECLNFKYTGICFAILSSIFCSLSTVVIKAIPKYHAFNLSTWRFQGVLWPNIIIHIYYWMTGNSKILTNVWPMNQPNAKRNLVMLLLRGLLAGGAVITQVYSLQYLELGDSTVITFSTPVFVVFLAHFILGERLGIVPVFISIFTIVGVVVITRPPILTGGEELSKETLIGIGMALSTMIICCATVIALRFLRDVNSILTTTSYGSVGTIICITLSLSFGIFELPQGKEDWIFVIALGFLTFLGQLFYTLALQYEEAGPISLVRTGDVIFAFIWQDIFFGILPDIYSIIGALIVICGVLVIGIRKWIESLPEKNLTRKSFWFLLL